MWMHVQGTYLIAAAVRRPVDPVVDRTHRNMLNTVVMATHIVGLCGQ